MASEVKYVYCYQLGSGNCYKVGRTKNDPEQGKRGFATGSPLRPTLYKKIETEYPTSLEKHIHQLLDGRRAENGEIFNVTSQELDDAVGEALEFVNKIEPLRRRARALQKTRPSDTMAEPTIGMPKLYRELRALGRDKYLIEQRIALLESEIQIAIGDNCGMSGVASWKWVDSSTVDVKRLQEELPDLCEKYKRSSGSRRFVLERVDLTDAKGKGHTHF